MPSTIVLGTQFGDEGKGKIVDFLSEDAEIVARFQGGNNAGHTIVVKGKTFKLHFIPSGVIRGKEVALGNGMVIEPNAFLEEIKTLQDLGVSTDKLTLSDRAHVITQEHLDEDAKDEKIGTTKKGIGPTYAAKVARTGVRICDTMDQYPELKKYIGDVSLKLNQALDAGKNVLFEGAQGTHLDIDFGTYPFVTSSNTIAGGACTGTGVGPTKIDKVIGVAKAYTTRVGEGPLPTELKGEVGKHLLDVGGEYGTTTGRPRRCGWFDSVLVNHAVRVNGLSSIALTKIDVLSGLNTLKLCTAYETSDGVVTELPSNPETFSNAKPIYEEINGWPKYSPEEWREFSKNGFDSFPAQVIDYVKKIEELCKTDIYLISYGPTRSDTFIKG